MDGEADLDFARLAGEYLDDRAERHPEVATGLGDHRFDDRLADPSAAPSPTSGAPWTAGRPGWTCWIAIR